MKPHLKIKRWCDGRLQWVCRSTSQGLQTGIGNTPAEAYRLWQIITKHRPVLRMVAGGVQ